jgi:hypothetical protein
MPVTESPIGHLAAVTEAQAADGQTFKVDRLEADSTRTVWLAVTLATGGWLCRWYTGPGGLQYEELRWQPPNLNGGSHKKRG